MATSILPHEAWWRRENQKSWSTSRRTPVAAWQQPRIPRDHVWNFWTGQRQSLCHTEPGPAHMKLRSSGISLTPSPAFVFSAHLWLHQVRESSEAPSLTAAQQRDVAAGTYPPAQRQQAQHKQNNNDDKKKKKRLLNKSAPKPFKKLLSWRV